MSALTYEQALEAAKRGCLIRSQSRKFLIRYNNTSGNAGWEYMAKGGWTKATPGAFSENGNFAIFHDPRDCNYATDIENVSCCEVAAIMDKCLPTLGSRPSIDNGPNYGDNGPLKPEPLPLLRLCQNCSFWSQAQNSQMGLCANLQSRHTHTTGLDGCSLFIPKKP